jgi:translocation and assembly module TamB
VLIAAGSLLGLAVLLVAAGLVVIQTEWFRDLVRERIIREVETATGGRAEIRSFAFYPRQLRAEIDDFVLHGTEGAGEPPLLRAASLQVGLKIVSVLKRDIDIAYLGIHQPEVRIRVAADGSTNIPKPRVKGAGSGKDPLDTIVDLAIRRFEITNGLAAYASRKIPIDVRGENLQARLDYQLLRQGYAGDISISPVWVRTSGPKPLPVNTKIGLEIGRNRFEIMSATLDTPASRVTLSAEFTDLAQPSGTLRMNGKLSPAELQATLGSGVRLAEGAPHFYVALAAGLEGEQLDLVSLQAGIGRSRIQVAGALSDIHTLTGSLEFKGALALGELGRILKVAARPEGSVEIGGNARLAGTRDYKVSAKVTGSGLAFQTGGRRIAGASAAADITADPRLVALRNVRLNALGGTLTASADIAGREGFRVDGKLAGFNLRTLARAYASRDLVWDGTISGPVHVAGSLRGPIANRLVARAGLSIAPGTQGVPLGGRLEVLYDGPREAISLGNSYVALPSTRLDLSGSIGQQLQVRLASTDLDDLLPAIALASDKPPGEFPVALQNGAARFDGTVMGRLSDPRIAGRVAVTNFAVRGEKFDRLAADVSAEKSGAAVQNAVVSRGRLAVRLDASAGLRNWKPAPEQTVTAAAAIRNARVEELAALAGRSNLRITGQLGAEAHVSGTFGDPRATLDLAVLNGRAYDEPFERLSARVNYTARAVEVASLQFVAGGGRLDANAVFEHPPNQFDTGRVAFHVASKGIRLEELQTVQLRQPALKGTLDLNADGNAAVDFRPGKPRVLFSKLDAALKAGAVEADARSLGNLTATATTRGKELLFRLESDLAESKIQGAGTVVLDGDFPLNAKVSFSPVRIAAVRRLIAQARPGQSRDFDGVVEGEVQVKGPSVRPEELRGSVRLSRVELTAPAGASQQMVPALRNRGPVVVSMERSVVRIEQARFSGKSTDLALGGSMSLRSANPLDVRVDGKIGLDLLEQFSPGIYASGAVLLNAAVQGKPAQPLINGKLELKNASFNHADAPNGIANANGVILFSGSQAAIQSFTGESGGGTVTLAGFVRYAGSPDFRLQANAKQVRVRYPPGASTKVNAALDLSGSAKESVLGGSVEILEAAFHSQTDLGSMLSKAGEPPRAPEAKTGLLGNMRLNIRIDTAPGARFQTALAQNLQAEAHLELRGTPSRPGMLGRVAVTQGEIVFFGSKYTINQGTISFFDPQKVEPVVNIDLQTRARGVEVFLSVTGAVGKMRLAYRSDPPLQFSDIVSLLATGKPPTSDPVLAAREPAAPEQSFQQMGASTLLGQAVANPVAGRLQRLFGVTKLKIDPQLTGAENNPQARLTLEQQITTDLYFTYIQDLTQSNPQVVRVEWAFDPSWSAIAVRQENGQFGLDFYYKKRFK